MAKRAWQRKMDEMTDEALRDEIEIIEFDREIIRPEAERIVEAFFGNDNEASDEVSEEHLAEYRSLWNRKKYAKKLLKRRQNNEQKK